MDDNEYTVDVPALFADDKPLRITVDKTGGGTLGSSYTGQWVVGWFHDGDLMSMEILTTGMPKTHEEVARTYVAFITSDMDTDETWPTYDRLLYWAESDPNDDVLDSDNNEE